MTSSSWRVIFAAVLLAAGAFSWAWLFKNSLCTAKCSLSNSLVRPLPRPGPRPLSLSGSSPPSPTTTKMRPEMTSKTDDTCRVALRTVPSATAFAQDANGAKAFVAALLERQAALQRCMTVQSTLPLRALVHRCLSGMLCGGLGDRLRGTSLALIIAAITDRALFIDHEKPPGASLQTYLEPSGEVNWLMSSLSETTLEWISKHMTSRSHIDRTPGGCSVWGREWISLKPKAVVGLSSNIPPTRICVRKLFRTLLGEAAFALVSKINEFELTKLALYRLYKPTALVKNRFSNMLAKLTASSSKQTTLDPDCTICFHIRTGKNVGAERAVDDVMSQNFQDFGKCGALVEKQRAKSKKCTSTMWLIATDLGVSPALFRILSPYSKNATLLSTRVLGPAFQVDRYTAGQAKTKEQVQESVLRVMTDFHLLQSCRFLVRSPSQFSLMATLSGPVGDDGVRYTVPHTSGCNPSSLNEHMYPIDERSA